MTHILLYEFGPKIQPNSYSINLGNSRFGPKKDLATVEMTRAKIVFWRGHFVVYQGCDQNGDRVSKNDKSCHICIWWLKSHFSEQEKYGTLYIYWNGDPKESKSGFQMAQNFLIIERFCFHISTVFMSGFNKTVAYLLAGFVY